MCCGLPGRTLRSAPMIPPSASKPWSCTSLDGTLSATGSSWRRSAVGECSKRLSRRFWVNMPNSTLLEARVVGATGNIVKVESDAPMMKNSIALVHVGDARLKGEVLRVQGRNADLQIFEETQ